MLLTRYGSVDYVLNLDVEDGVRQILKAIQKQDEQRHWELWLTLRPLMSKENYQSFSSFYKNPVSHPTSDRSKEEILADAEMILESLRKGGG